MKPAYKTRKLIYSITLFFITVSGFAQMPIFKRYYIADIPGFGWLAQYYVTHVMHYIAAGVIIALAVYIVLDFIFNSANYNKLIFTDYFKIFIIAGLIISGSLMVYKNLSDIYFNHNLIIALDILHISLCMMLLGVSFYTLIKGKKSKRTY
ncbi:MAG: hypothetical protein KAJ62_13305 [Desulfobacteraceae bacterium]|nr:hypothetical protein [Desulfobacteraceae bacterium]